MQVSPGEFVRLTCSHNSQDRSVRYSWSRQDGNPLPSFRFEIGGRRGEILRISLTEVSDSGVYVCKVQTDFGELVGQGQVIVEDTTRVLTTDSQLPTATTQPEMTPTTAPGKVS